MGAQEKMPLPEDVTGDIEEVASGWAAVGKAVMNTQVAADHTDGVPGWIGAAADAYTGAIKKLGGHARTLGGSFAPAVTALHTWEAALKTMITTTVPEFWRRHDDAVDVYNRGIAALNDEIEAARQSGEVYPQDVIDQRESSLVSTLKETWDGIISEYLVAMDGLDTNANDAAFSTRSSIRRNRIHATRSERHCLTTSPWSMARRSGNKRSTWLLRWQMP